MGLLPGPRHADLLQIDLPTFWFLYEGTPGGVLDAQGDFVIRPDSQKTTLGSTLVAGRSPGSASVRPRRQSGFVLVNHQDPGTGEVDSYVSWPFRKEATDRSRT